jgi:hypothetical protein
MNPEGDINWTYIWATLLIRFVGVFIILAILQIALAISSRIIAKLFPPNKQ